MQNSNLSNLLNFNYSRALEFSRGAGLIPTTIPMIFPAATQPDTTTAPLATAEGDMEAEAEVGEGFCLLESAPATHRFRLSMLQPSEPRSFYSAVKREIKLLKSDLPPGVSTSSDMYVLQ